MAFLIIILIGILSSAVSFISSSGSIVNPSESGIKHIAKRGWLFIISSSVLVFLPVVQNYISDRESNRKELIAKLEQDRRDSTIRHSYDSSTTAIILNMSEALAKYGLKYDSAKKSIEKLVKDSAQRNITVIQENAAALDVCNITMKKNQDTTTFMFEICYKYSPYNIDIKLTTVINNNGKFENSGSINKFINIAKLDNEGRVEIPKFHFKGPRTNRYYFYLKGTYTNREKTKTFQYTNIYYYEPDDISFGIISTGILEKEILECINSTKKNL